MNCVSEFYPILLPIFTERLTLSPRHSGAPETVTADGGKIAHLFLSIDHSVKECHLCLDIAFTIFESTSKREYFVPGVNISRSEAQERSAHIALASYEVRLDLTQGNETFLSKSMAKFSCNKPGYSTFIDAVGKKIISATLNGLPVDISNYDGETIYLNNLAAENEIAIEIEALYSKSGEGLQLSIDTADNEVYLYSQGETAYTRRMFPCFDQPDLKATYTLSAIVPAHWEVITNNPVKNKLDLDSGGTSGSGKVQWNFTTTPRISTYLMALIAGPYSHVHDTYHGKKSVPLGIYCRKSLAISLDPEDIFLITKQGFEYFEKVFGLAYPFEKYDQIAVLDFNWGAMENPGCVTFLESLLVFRSKVTERMYNARANTILHEMAHMWFGDFVTMSWWDDLWLNESFAEWSSYLALVEGTRFKNSWAGFNSERKNWAYRQDQLTSTHPIVADMVDIEAVNANFDGITYAKGASVLQQLVAHVGRDNFIKGLQKYFTKHAWKNATLQDLIFELEATSGRDLTPWVSTWLQTAGVNTLRPVLEIKDGHYKSVAIAQEAPLIPIGSKELRPHRMAVALYDLRGGSLTLRRSVEIDLTGSLTHIKELDGEVVADLLLINDRDLTYAKIRFDDHSIATLKKHLGKVDDGLARVLCWSAAWDMLRDAEISATEFAEIALAGLPSETNITVVTALAMQFLTVIELYAAPKNRDHLREKIATEIEKLLNAASPSSDHQLQFARTFATLAQTPAQGARIASLLNSELAGLKVDADLRWHFLTTLVERGLATEEDIDGEYKRDKTVTGELARELCISALPNASAKAVAWDKATMQEITNSKRVAAIQGFARPRHRELVSAYIDKYFDLLLSTWGAKSFEVASKIVTGLYPAYIVSAETLDKTNKWLNTTGKDAPASLRRLVSEARDSMERAVKVQARDK